MIGVGMFRFVAIAVTFVIHLSAIEVLAGNVALVVIDMQDYFVEKTNAEWFLGNTKKLNKVLAHQTQVIQLAKSQGTPIIMVSFRDRGEINASIAEAVGSYKASYYLTKSTNSLFDPKNQSTNYALRILKAWDVTDLLIIGANGDYCVKDSIVDAVRLGYKVRTYIHGVADFDRKIFEYPYLYSATFESSLNTQIPSAFGQFGALSSVKAYLNR